MLYELRYDFLRQFDLFQYDSAFVLEDLHQSSL
jgi:hypothetical protein